MKLWCVSCALFLTTAAQAGEEIKGEISAIDPARGSFEISGVRIEARGAAVRGLLRKTSLDKLKPGDSVRAKGAFTAPLVFTARKVARQLFSDNEIEGILGGVKPRERTLLISGVAVKVLPRARIEDSEGRPLHFEKLRAGRKVEVEGYWAGPGRFNADSVEVRSAL